MSRDLFELDLKWFCIYLYWQTTVNSTILDQTITIPYSKVGCVFPMAISSESRMAQTVWGRTDDLWFLLEMIYIDEMLVTVSLHWNRHQHTCSDSVTNIYRHHKVTNITLSPTSLYCCSLEWSRMAILWFEIENWFNYSNELFNGVFMCSIFKLQFKIEIQFYLVDNFIWPIK